jgi:hypothetical protein
MRDKTLGRWIVRWVVTLSAGLAVMGLSTAAAEADVRPARGIGSVAGTVSIAIGQLTAVQPDVPVAEDWGWE